MSYNDRPPGRRWRPQQISSSAFSRNQERQRGWNTTENADSETFAPSYGFNGCEEEYGRDPVSSYPIPPRDRWSQDEEPGFPDFPGSSRVEHVHHDSPIGPAVSVFPRESYNRKQPQSMQSYPHHYEARNYRTPSRPCHYYEASAFTPRHYSPTTVVDHGIESFIRVKSDPDRKMVEISPGVRVPLRGAAETEKAIEEVSPVSTEDAFPKSAYGVQGEGGGLGLGVTTEIFEDILRKFRTTRGYRT